MDSDIDSNIRDMKQAGRFVSSVKVTVRGKSTSYWDLDKHPLVFQELVAQGYSRSAVDTYINSSSARRRDLSRGMAERGRYGPIEDALYDLMNEGELIHQLKSEFYAGVSDEWLEAMVIWNYKFTGEDKARDAIEEWLKVPGNNMSDLDYRQLTENALRNAA